MDIGQTSAMGVGGLRTEMGVVGQASGVEADLRVHGDFDLTSVVDFGWLEVPGGYYFQRSEIVYSSEVTVLEILVGLTSVMGDDFALGAVSAGLGSGLMVGGMVALEMEAVSASADLGSGTAMGGMVVLETEAVFLGRGFWVHYYIESLTCTGGDWFFQGSRVDCIVGYTFASVVCHNRGSWVYLDPADGHTNKNCHICIVFLGEICIQIVYFLHLSSDMVVAFLDWCWICPDFWWNF